MTYSDAIARGSSQLHYIAEVEGIQYALGTSDLYPADSWYSTEGHSYLQGLRPGSISRSCAARPGEVWPDLRSFNLEFDDTTGALAAHLKSIDGCTTTELTASLTSSATTINVVDTSAFASSGVVHIEREAIAYSGKTATSFTGCTRGYYGSEAVEHIYSTTVFPECIPLASSGPAELRGRRVVIYAAEYATTGTSAASQIWIGYVKGSEWWEGSRVFIPVAHALDGFMNGQVMGCVPEARLNGLYVPNTDGNRWGRIVVGDPNNGDQTLDLVTDGSTKLYASSGDLVREFVTEFNDHVTDWEAGLLPDGRVFIVCLGTPPVGTYPLPTIQSSGQLPTILGFGTETTGGTWTLSLDFGERFEADRAPANVFAVTHPAMETFEPRLYVGEGQAQLFTESYCRVVDGSGGERTLAITDINTTDDYLVVSRVATDFPVSMTADVLMQFGAGLAPSIHQVWGENDLWIDDLVRLLWSGQKYSGSTSYTLPDRWLPEPSLRDGDVDWTTLRELCSGQPALAGKVFLNVREPTRAVDLVTGNLMACGVYAYVKEDGSVGWRRVELPTEPGITTTVSGSYIDGRRCGEIKSERNRDRLTNVYRFEVANAHLVLSRETAGAGTPSGLTGANIVATDNASLGRYGARVARLQVNSLGEVTDTIKLSAPPSVFFGIGPASEALGRNMAGTLKFLGRPRSRVRLPVTIAGRALECGDAVYLTSGWVKEPTTGVQGVTAAVCLVLGWERPEGFDAGATDWLDLLLIDDPAGAIAPAALATAWNAGTGVLTFANTDLFHGDDDTSDLQFFEVGDLVEVIQYDDETPTIGYGTVSAVNTVGKTVTITSTSGTFTMPAIVRFRVYSSCSADQQGEGWIWTCGDDDGQVQNLRAGWRWN